MSALRFTLAEARAKVEAAGYGDICEKTAGKAVKRWKTRERRGKAHVYDGKLGELVADHPDRLAVPNDPDLEALVLWYSKLSALPSPLYVRGDDVEAQENVTPTERSEHDTVVCRRCSGRGNEPAPGADRELRDLMRSAVVQAAGRQILEDPKIREFFDNAANALESSEPCRDCHGRPVPRTRPKRTPKAETTKASAWKDAEPYDWPEERGARDRSRHNPNECNRPDCGAPGCVWSRAVGGPTPAAPASGAKVHRAPASGARYDSREHDSPALWASAVLGGLAGTCPRYSQTVRCNETHASDGPAEPVADLTVRVGRKAYGFEEICVIERRLELWANSSPEARRDAEALGKYYVGNDWRTLGQTRDRATKRLEKLHAAWRATDPGALAAE
jgi:hypothetical protein